MNRRDFAGLSLAVVGSIFVPKYGGWYKQGSGVLVRPPRPLIRVQGSGDGCQWFDLPSSTYTVTDTGVMILDPLTVYWPHPQPVRQYRALYVA